MKTRVLVLFAMLFALGALQGQDLYLTFSGSGASTSVDSVWVENLTRGEKSVVTGSQVLHLEQMVTGTEKVSADVKSGITFSPNPMNEYSIMEFSLPASGKATISIIDLSGKEVLKISGSLSRGGHLYRLSGLKTGMHFVRVTGGRYSLTGTLISISSGGDARAEYLSTVPVREPGKDMAAPKKQAPEKKGDLSEVTMQFRDGDSLKFIAASGSYRTIVIDAPDTSKTMTFDFYECIDGDGNSYPVIVTGGHIWMAENLKTTKFSDGTPIRNETDDNIWASLDDQNIAAFSWYNNNETYKNIYGGLYNNPAVSGASGKNVCPAGWHVAAEEWDELFLSLDNTALSDGEVSTSAGNLIKESGSVHWGCPDNRATNETGFTALPGGLRRPDFAHLGQRAYFWNGSQGKFILYCTNGVVGHIYGMNDYGLSVRCVRNEEEQEVNVSFAGTGASNTVTSVKVENLSTGAALTLNGDQTLHLGHGSGPEGTVFMEYATGQNLKVTGISGNYSTVIVDRPDEDKTITFNFIPCTDGDGNNYPVIKIGADIWMAENLKATKFNDGTPVQNMTDTDTWKAAGPHHVPAYCWYNNEAKNKDIYGALYNEGAVTTVSGKNVCPVGWHVADGEWIVMLGLLDSNILEQDSYTAGLLLKETGNKHWECSNNGSTNETGFTALPGGLRYVNDPSFQGIGKNCLFWCGANGKFVMDCNGSGVNFSEGWDDYGLSVRCVKDK